MKNFKNQLMLAAVLTVLALAGVMRNPHAASAQSAPVNIVSPVPLPIIRDEGSPFAASLYACFSGLSTYSCSANTDTFTVPAQHHLMIEYVSGTCQLEAGVSSSATLSDVSLDVTTAGVRHLHNVASLIPEQVVVGPTDTTSTVAAHVKLAFAQPTRLYADPSTNVLLFPDFASLGESGGAVACNVSISGRLTTP